MQAHKAKMKENVVALWSRKQELIKQGRGSSRKGYMWNVCRGSRRCGRGSIAEAVAEAVNNFLSTTKEKKQNSPVFKRQIQSASGIFFSGSEIYHGVCWYATSKMRSRKNPQVYWDGEDHLYCCQRKRKPLRPPSLSPFNVDIFPNKDVWVWVS